MHNLRFSRTFWR